MPGWHPWWWRSYPACVNWVSRKTAAYTFTRVLCQNEQNKLTKKIKIWHVKFQCSQLMQVSKEKKDNSGQERRGTKKALIRKVALGAWLKSENIAGAQENFELNTSAKWNYWNTDNLQFLLQFLEHATHFPGVSVLCVKIPIVVQYTFLMLDPLQSVIILLYTERNKKSSYFFKTFLAA